MLSALIDTYAVHLEAEGKSPKTTDWHRASLGKFGRWLAEAGHPENPTEWTPAVIRAYFVALRHMTTRDGRPLAAHSVKSYGNSLRSFCRWLHVEEFVEKDVMERVKPPAAPRLVKPVLSDDECRAVLTAAKAGRNALRDEAILLFMLDTGVRANEVCTLAVSDCQWSQRLAKVYGKGAKERYVPFSAATIKAIQRYMLRARTGESDRLFQSEEGRALTTSGLLQLCQRLGQKAGVDLHPHKCRHTFAISYLRSGASVFALQKTLGHTTLDMSLRYAAFMTEDLVNDHKAHSPVAALLCRNGKR